MDNDEFQAFMAKAKRDMEKRTLVNWWVNRQLRNHAAYVDGDLRRVKYLTISFMTQGLLSVVLCLVVATVIGDGAPWWITFLVIVAVAYTSANSASVGIRRAQLYRDGWLTGRMRMREEFEEAHKRGFTDGEWLVTTYERDAQVIW